MRKAKPKFETKIIFNRAGEKIKLTKHFFISGPYRIARMVFWNVTPAKPGAVNLICINASGEQIYYNFRYLVNGTVAIGCYRFTQKHSKTLLKWMGYAKN